MRIGLDEVIIGNRNNGVRQRDFNILEQLLQQIAARNWEAKVYMSQDIDREAIESLMPQTDKIQSVRTPLPSERAAIRTFRGAFYWRSQVARDNVQVLHTSYFPIPRIPVPVVLTVNDLRFVQYPETYSTARRMFLNAVVPSSLRRATRLIAVSEYTKYEITHYFGINPEKIDIAYIPPGPGFRPIEDRDALKRVQAQLGLPDRYILTVGALQPRKNLKRLFEAYIKLRSEKKTDQKLVIVGARLFGFNETVEFAKKSPYADDIIFSGYVSDEALPLVYNGASMLVFPSIHEGFGVPIVEAMACGIPVVASNVTALPEVAGGAALLFDPMSSDCIADAMCKVLEDDQCRRDLTERGFRRMAAFAPSQIASDIITTYEKVAG